MNPTLPSPHIISGPFPIIHSPRSLPVWKFYDPTTRRYLPFARDVSLFLDAACFLRNSTTCGFIDRAAFPSTRILFVTFPEWRLDIPQLRGHALRVPVTREVPDERMLFRIVQTDEHEYNFEVAVMAEGDESKNLKWMPVPEGTVERDLWEDPELEAEEGLKARAML